MAMSYHVSTGNRMEFSAGAASTCTYRAVSPAPLFLGFLYSLGWTELVEVFLPLSPNCWEARISMLSLPRSSSDIRKDLIWEETHLVIETFLNLITSSG